MNRLTSATRLGAGLALAWAVAACGGGASSPGTGASPAAPTLAPSSPSPSGAVGGASGSPGLESPPASPAPASPGGSPAASPAGSPAARTVPVFAIEGQFQNPPVDPAPGTVLTFRNVGQEAHSMVVLRRNDDATDAQSFEALAEGLADLQVDDVAGMLEWVEVVGVLTADPGQEAEGQIVLEEPGDYAIVDLLPQGTATAPASFDPMAIPAGVPNVATGMLATFTVVGPEAS